MTNFLSIYYDSLVSTCICSHLEQAISVAMVAN